MLLICLLLSLIPHSTFGMGSPETRAIVTSKCKKCYFCSCAACCTFVECICRCGGAIAWYIKGCDKARPVVSAKMVELADQAEYLSNHFEERRNKSQSKEEK